MAEAKDDARVWLVILNAAAAVAIVILQDPGLRQDFVLWWRKVATPVLPRYDRRQPTRDEVAAVLARAEAITREGDG